MPDLTPVADQLDRSVRPILAAWESAVAVRRRAISEPSGLTRQELLDHIPELLGDLARRLRGEEDRVGATAKEHGRHRWSQGYDPAGVIDELGLLRGVLLRWLFELDRAGEVRLGLDGIEAAVAAVVAVVDRSQAASIAQFQAENDRIQRVVLDEFETRKVAAEADRVKIQGVLNNLPVGVWVSDAAGDIIGVNRVAERLQGCAESETIGRVNVRDPDQAYRFHRPDGSEVPIAEAPMARALLGEAVDREDLAWAIGGHVYRISANAAPLGPDDGPPTGAVMVIQDLTDRKRLEDELARTEAQFRGIVAKSPVMIWRSDPAGVCNFFNETWLEFRGRPEADEVGDGWTEGVHPDDLEHCLAARAAATARRETFEIVYRLRHADGGYRWLTERGVPVEDAAGRFLGFLGSCLDITARVELEAELQRQSRHKSRLMAALSHDARTPLNAVVLSAQLLESHIQDSSDPEVGDCLRTIRHAVRNVLDLLTDLLDLSRIDAGATPVESSRFELRPTLAECLSGIEPQARAKGLDVALESDGLDPLWLETDRAKLKQILSNFLSNALAYTRRGRIRLRATTGGGRVRIAVEDTGVGIAAEDQAKIFDEFAVLEHPNRQRGEGTGLGLAICRRLASLLGGEIRVESVPGSGSTFALVLPGSIARREAPPAETPPAGPGRSFAGPILIAEDHADSRRTLAKVLRRLGYQVLEAGDGQEAIDEARRARPMLVLMDVNMPGLDGVEATLELRRDPNLCDVPIYALTGDVSPINQRRIEEAGVDGYLEKPVTWERLEAVLDRLGQPAGAGRA